MRGQLLLDLQSHLRSSDYIFAALDALLREHRIA